MGRSHVLCPELAKEVAKVVDKKRVVVLGGCGRMGQLATKSLAERDLFAEIVIADIDEGKAEQLARQLQGTKSKVSAKWIDASQEEALVRLIRDANVVVHMIGPYHKLGAKVAKAAIKAGVNYADILDDFNVTPEVLALDELARNAGVTILTNLGLSPGLTNSFAKRGADKLDQVDEIHVAWVASVRAGDPTAWTRRLLKLWAGDVPSYRDGQVVNVAALSDEETITFPGPPGEARVCNAGHPEPITIPRFIKGVRVVTHKGGFMPPRIYQFIRNMIEYGFTSSEPIRVRDMSVTPADFIVAFVSSEIAANAKGLRLHEIASGLGLQIRVAGKRGGKAVQYTYQCFDPSPLGATVSHLVTGVEMLARNEITMKGVICPEALDPEPFISSLVSTTMVCREIEEAKL